MALSRPSITLGVSGGPPAERHSSTSIHTTAAEEWAERGIWGAAFGAVETAASHYARAFAGASVQPAIPVLTPAVIGVDGGTIRLTECGSWSVVAGGPRPETWR